MKKNIDLLKKDQRKFSSKKRIILNQTTNIDKILYDKLKKHKWFAKSKIIASFSSIKTEISTIFLNNFIQNSGKILCLPMMNQIKQKLIFRKYSTGDLLIKGKFNVNEPMNSEICLPDIIFVPCLAFDTSGYRLGYGGGYYDRTIFFLNSINHFFITIGFAYDDQRVDEVVHDHLDQKLNYILTEKQLYEIL